ncbi:hypothetical protein EJB05_01421, partial [Eragrostis curvula]
MGQSQSTWPQPKAEKDRPPRKAEKLRPPGGGRVKRQELLRKMASTEDPKKKKAFDAYPSRDNNLVLTVSLDAITRIG